MSYKQLMNSLAKDSNLRTLSENEVKTLRKIFLEAYSDLKKCCDQHNLTVMLIGGTVLGAVRHKGFIPWDDDLDVAMPRADFEVLKKIFKKELGKKYLLASPNYEHNATNRFPMMLVRDTLLVEAGRDPKDENAKIKIDIFIIENIPDNIIFQKCKGLWCTILMAIGSFEGSYEERNSSIKKYLCKSKKGKRTYQCRVFLGRLFSFFSFQKWMDIVDKALQYNKKTSLMGIPSGRGHYFGEIRPTETFLPPSKGKFEGMEVLIPGNANDYLSNLYGKEYMALPPIEKREQHFIYDIQFKENK